MKRKEHDLNQTLRELCSVLLFSGVYPFEIWNQMFGLKIGYLLLMVEILHQLIGSLSHYLQKFIHPRWLFGISEPSTVSFAPGFWCLQQYLIGSSPRPRSRPSVRVPCPPSPGAVPSRPSAVRPSTCKSPRHAVVSLFRWIFVTKYASNKKMSMHVYIYTYSTCIYMYIYIYQYVIDMNGF